MSACQTVHAAKPQAYSTVEERSLAGKVYKIYFQAHMKDMGKSSYMLFIWILCGQLGPILQRKAKYFLGVLALLGLL